MQQLNDDIVLKLFIFCLLWIISCTICIRPVIGLATGSFNWAVTFARVDQLE